MAVWQYLSTVAIVCVGLTQTGCMSPYYRDQGALFGGSAGALTGAIVGQATGGNPLVGAAVGGIAGAVTGSVVGGAIDESEARNRAAIEASLQRSLPVGTVSANDVVEMSRAGVAEDLIVNHVRANGVAAPPSAQELIYLQQQGVSPRVVAAMQAPPQVRQASVQQVQPVIIRESAPVIVSGYWGPPPRRYYHRHHPHCW